jgi:hypothetical protein
MRKSVDKEAIMDRPAVSEDVEAMLDLVERRREQYQELSWRGFRLDAPAG